MQQRPFILFLHFKLTLIRKKTVKKNTKRTPMNLVVKKQFDLLEQKLKEKSFKDEHFRETYVDELGKTRSIFSLLRINQKYNLLYKIKKRIFENPRETIYYLFRNKRSFSVMKDPDLIKGEHYTVFLYIIKKESEFTFYEVFETFQNEKNIFIDQLQKYLNNNIQLKNKKQYNLNSRNDDLCADDNQMSVKIEFYSNREERKSEEALEQLKSFIKKEEPFLFPKKKELLSAGFFRKKSPYDTPIVIKKIVALNL